MAGLKAAVSLATTSQPVSNHPDSEEAMWRGRVGELVTLDTSLSAGLPVHYRLDWGDGGETEVGDCALSVLISL